MSYEVAEGQELIHSGKRYKAGAIAPAGCDAASLCAVGVLVQIRKAMPAARPDPEPVPSSQRAGFDPSDPATIKNVTVKTMASALAGVDDVEALKAMHSVESRKGAKDAIEERLGELEASA